MVNDNSHNRTSAAWPPLAAGEILLWEGRPAPRCFTFRRWRQALYGGVLTCFCAAWGWIGLGVAAEHGWPWLALVPLPFLAFALWLSAGQLLAARLEWPRVAYAITDRRVLVRRGLRRTLEDELPLARLSWFRLQPHGEELGSLRIHGGEGDPVLFFHCVEYPRRPAEFLEAAIKQNGGHE